MRTQRLDQDDHRALGAVIQRMKADAAAIELLVSSAQGKTSSIAKRAGRVSRALSHLASDLEDLASPLWPRDKDTDFLRLYYHGPGQASPDLKASLRERQRQDGREVE